MHEHIYLFIYVSVLERKTERERETVRKGEIFKIKGEISDKTDRQIDRPLSCPYPPLPQKHSPASTSCCSVGKFFLTPGATMAKVMTKARLR